MALATYSSALALEVRKNDEGESYIHTRFKNGTGGFETIHLFGHGGDIFLNELLYRLDVSPSPILSLISWHFSHPVYIHIYY